MSFIREMETKILEMISATSWIVFLSSQKLVTMNFCNILSSQWNKIMFVSSCRALVKVFSVHKINVHFNHLPSDLQSRSYFHLTPTKFTWCTEKYTLVSTLVVVTIKTGLTAKSVALVGLPFEAGFWLLIKMLSIVQIPPRTSMSLGTVHFLIGKESFPPI